MAAAAINSRSPRSLPLLLLLLFSLQILWIPSLASSLDGRRRNLLAYTGRTRRGVGGGPNCRELSSKEECESKSQWCKWCTSDAIDDMCFGTAEAWRLPAQVFSCPPHRA